MGWMQNGGDRKIPTGHYRRGIVPAYLPSVAEAPSSLITFLANLKS